MLWSEAIICSGLPYEGIKKDLKSLLIFTFILLHSPLLHWNLPRPTRNWGRGHPQPSMPNYVSSSLGRKFPSFSYDYYVWRSRNRFLRRFSRVWRLGFGGCQVIPDFLLNSEAHLLIIVIECWLTTFLLPSPNLFSVVTDVSL